MFTSDRSVGQFVIPGCSITGLRGGDGDLVAERLVLLQTVAGGSDVRAHPGSGREHATDLCIIEHVTRLARHPGPRRGDSRGRRWAPEHPGSLAPRIGGDRADPTTSSGSPPALREGGVGGIGAGNGRSGRGSRRRRSAGVRPDMRRTGIVSGVSCMSVASSVRHHRDTCSCLAPPPDEPEGVVRGARTCASSRVAASEARARSCTYARSRTIQAIYGIELGGGRGHHDIAQVEISPASVSGIVRRWPKGCLASDATAGYAHRRRRRPPEHHPPPSVIGRLVRSVYDWTRASGAERLGTASEELIGRWRRRSASRYRPARRADPDARRRDRRDGPLPPLRPARAAVARAR